jgi:serine/threonine-protein kinase
MFPLGLLALLLIAAALVIGRLGAELPAIVAVHFNAAGAANGFATREDCCSFMLIFTLVAPVIVAAVAGLVPRLAPPSMINIPNREYWLAPERARDSILFLSDQGIWFASMLTAFLASVDWMVARANASTPPHLPAAHFAWIMVAFAGAIALWVLRMFKRFRVPHRP